MHLSITRNQRAFTALEALVMLAILFILSILLIGLVKKKNKDDEAPDQEPAKMMQPQSSDKNSPTKKTP